MSFKSLSIVAAAALALCGGAAQAQVAGLADGGFEIAANGPGEFADGWQAAGAFTTRTSAQAHSGLYSALLAIPDNPNGGAGTGLFQNSVDHGGLLAVDPLNWGSTPTLSFWVKGNVSVTGNLNYDLRYLDSSGHILNTGSSSAQTIWTGNFDHGWTQITRSGIAIPTNTSAVFMEMTLATGPTGPAVPCGVDPVTGLPVTCNWGSANVYVDDVNITLANPVAAVPEPESYAMMLAGLGVVGSIVRRRRRSV
jgi:PEP-CTERM motif